MYPAGFANYPAKGDPFRPNEYLFFMAHFTFEPSFIVDVTDYYDRKVEAVTCYKSQLHDQTRDGLETLISQPTFLKRLEGRARNYGSMIYREFGEPFLVRRPVPVEDPVALYEPFTKIYASHNGYEQRRRAEQQQAQQQQASHPGEQARG